MTPDELVAEVCKKRAEMNRLPIHWAEKRNTLADEIDDLVEQWIEAAT